MEKQTYKYIKNNSIIMGLNDDYVLTENQFYRLYSFYVTYSMCQNQSDKSRSFMDYGWSDNQLTATDGNGIELNKALNKVINLSNSNCVFTDKDNLKEKFAETNLQDGTLTDLKTERMVIARTNAQNKYLKLFYRVRDCLSHGKFVLKYSPSLEKMVVMQDNDINNVTARIVIKLTTLLGIIDCIDILGIIARVDDFHNPQDAA